MSMSPSSRKELNKLRELTAFLLVGRVCHFCQQPLSDTAEAYTSHGNSVGPKLLEQLTIHHLDGVHENNTHSNKALCHTKCHKSFHRREANLARGREALARRARAEMEEDAPLVGGHNCPHCGDNGCAQCEGD